MSAITGIFNILATPCTPDGEVDSNSLRHLVDFQLALGAQDEAAFHERKLREIVLSRRADGVYGLSFHLADLDEPDAGPVSTLGVDAEIPEYVMVEETV